MLFHIPRERSQQCHYTDIQYLPYTLHYCKHWQLVSKHKYSSSTHVKTSVSNCLVFTGDYVVPALLCCSEVSDPLKELILVAVRWAPLCSNVWGEQLSFTSAMHSTGLICYFAASRHGPDFHRSHSQITIHSPDFIPLKVATDISVTIVGESPDSLLLLRTVVGENPDHVCWGVIMSRKMAKRRI